MLTVSCIQKKGRFSVYNKDFGVIHISSWKTCAILNILLKRNLLTNSFRYTHTWNHSFSWPSSGFGKQKQDDDTGSRRKRKAWKLTTWTHRVTAWAVVCALSMSCWCCALLYVVSGKFTDNSGFVCLCRRPVVRLGAMVLQRVGQVHALWTNDMNAWMNVATVVIHRVFSTTVVTNTLLPG